MSTKKHNIVTFMKDHNLKILDLLPIKFALLQIINDFDIKGEFIIYEIAQRCV